MEIDRLITVEQFCIHYEVEYSFIQSLTDYGLLEIITIEERPYLEKERIRDLEKMIRLHYDLDINIEGIEAIAHLLQRMDNLREEVRMLRNRLRRYEAD